MDPYTEEDALFFFGREQWQKLIIGKLKTCPITLLYGESGVGKSSLLRAGVVHQLHREAEQNQEQFEGMPKLAVVVFDDWSKPFPLKGLINSVRSSMLKALGIEKDELKKNVKELFKTRRKNAKNKNIARPSGVIQTLKAYAELTSGEYWGGKLLIILDQFEEYFVYQPKADKKRIFAKELCSAVNSSNRDVNFLISIRSDALFRLNQFSGQMPGIQDNYIELEHLDENSAKEAILKPVEVYNKKLLSDKKSVIVESNLVESILEELKNSDQAVANVGIEAPYLQLVMKRLWDEEIDAGSHRLRLETLEELHGTEQIISDHVKKAMDRLEVREQKTAARVLDYMVTPSGYKIPYSVGDLVYYTKLEDWECLADLLQKLASGDFRLLRPVVSFVGKSNEQRYEIFYNLLIKPIRDWLNDNRPESLDLKKYKLVIDKYLTFSSLKDVQGHWKRVKNSYWYWYRKARSLETSKHYKEAIAYYDQALKIRPQDYFSLYGQGSSLEQLGHDQKHCGNSLKAREFYWKAIESFKQALAANPKDYWSCYSRGYIELYELDQYEKAVASFEQALALRPNDDHALRHRDEALRKARKEVFFNS